jgi:hypothetical protein
MTGDGVEVTKADVESIWRGACGNRRIQVDHKLIGDVSTWVRYMFKSEWKYHEPGNRDCVVLFAKGTPRLPQATRAFFPAPAKNNLWRGWIAAWYPADEPVEVESPAVAPRPCTSTRVLTSARRWLSRRRSEVVHRRPGRPAARPARGAVRPVPRPVVRLAPRCLPPRGPPPAARIVRTARMGKPRRGQIARIRAPPEATQESQNSPQATPPPPAAEHQHDISEPPGAETQRGTTAP